MHKPPVSIADYHASSKEDVLGTAENTAAGSLENPAAEAKKRSADDTDSDHELNEEAAQYRALTGGKKGIPKMKAVEKIKLDVPQVLQDQGVPSSFVANHQQLLAQILTGKAGAAVAGTTNAAPQPGNNAKAA